ncbi:PspC domain-containing protein [Sporosarcina beigongshangi]|uniref:PspC domain-containing protein n=1 Tax=Sporosarcina beigongshangi TaxID=2782538 RepID=UPI0019397228|nr:PspC domain-containing protein [Sporosarcina beigongshangi]
MNKLTKSSSDKILFGVCGGMADFFNLPSLIVRLLFVFVPGSIAVYLIFALLLPKQSL